MKRVTLKDIADELDVSVSFVSKVLSGRMGTSSATPDQVRAIQRTASRLGYRPNRSATALATGKQGVVGVFIHLHGEPGSNIVEDFMVGVSGASVEHEQRVWLNLFSSRKEFKVLTRQVHPTTMDGLIISGVRHEDMVDDLLGLQAQGVPVVTVHPDPLSPELVNIGCSNLELGATATRHLLDVGCRQLAHFKCNAPRTFGFRYALESRGMAPDPELLVDVPSFSFGSGREATRVLLERGRPFDGLVCQSDHQACAAVQVLQEAGRSVPADVAVIGVDDSPICQFSPVHLSSVSQNLRERGRLAMDTLMGLVEGGKMCQLQSVSVTPTLHVRASSHRLCCHSR